ncbi:alpha/beta hydrolase family protein [Rhizobium sp. SL42]|uniref:alpha/beta hydrolase family protein n=1 Tax=Rhizobium sp. SL42 TaxID=2806346 RepID=UPI001F410381|nr:alpha/beta fold hydrolase [Rhizobium sp. SL42]UJW75699.1 alpha/beta fold hydrolase [Rhizobium sp. SL42]
MRSILAMLTLALAGGAAFAGQPVGVQTLAIAAPARTKPLAVTVWYPAASGGQRMTAGDNRIFEGTEVLRDAMPAKGDFPLILLSHGSGSRALGMAWIATALAEAGFVVAGPDHPGTSSGDSTPEATPKIWERTEDLSAVLDGFTTDKAWHGVVDPARVGVLGFSLGGTAAMEIAGARASLDAYIAYCDSYPAMMDCRWFKGGRGFVNDEEIKVPPLDLRSIDRRRFEQSNRDPRIDVAVLVDPGLATSFVPASLAAIDTPLAFINLGSSGEIPVAVLSDELATKTPGATYRQIEKADHFSFLPLCKPGSAAMLKQIGEPDPICGESPERSRADIHAELVDQIGQAFARMLKDGD